MGQLPPHGTEQAHPPHGTDTVVPGLLHSMWRYRWLVAAGTVLAIGVSVGASMLQPVLYEGRAELLLLDPGGEGVFEESVAFVDPTRYVRNQAEFASSSAVLLRAAQLARRDLSLEELRERVTVEPALDLDLLVVTALDPGAERAAELANAVGAAYQDLTAGGVRRDAEEAIDELEESQGQLRRRVQALEARIDAEPADETLRTLRDGLVVELLRLERRERQILVDQDIDNSGVQLFERATEPEEPVQPNPVRNGLLAAVLAVITLGAFSWWRAEHSLTADHRQDPAPVLRAPLLGEVPDFEAAGVQGPQPTVSAPMSVVAEAYRFVVSSLHFVLTEQGESSVLVTSAGPGDGKTVTALNVAAAAARDGGRVVLVDADERAQGLTRLSGLDAEGGLVDLGDPERPRNDCVHPTRLSDALEVGLVPVGSGIADGDGFFRASAFRRAMQRAREGADLLVVDSPPLLAVADASAIAGQVDGIVLVVVRGTPLRLLEEMRHRLEFVGTPVLGYVFNRSDPRRRRYGASGYYGRSYGAYPAGGRAGDGRRERVVDVTRTAVGRDR